MALIKGSKVDQGGSVVVAGDQVTVEDGSARPARGRRRSEAAEPGEPARAVERVVPMALAALEVVPAELAAETSAATLQEAEPQASARLPGPAEAQGVPQGDPCEGFDAARQAILEGAEASAQIAAQEAASRVPGPEGSFSELLDGATRRLSDALGVESPQLSAALDSLVPTLEQQAAATSELEVSRAAQQARWRELAGAHEQIAALLEGFEVSSDTARQLLAERERILAHARLEAERILGEAGVAAAAAAADAQGQIAREFEDFERTRHARYEQLVEQARAAGYTEGRAQADEEGAKILEEAIETLNRARLAYPKAVRENAQKLIHLALTVAEKIVCDEIAAKPEIALAILEAALTRVTDLETVVVRVNPEDLPLVEAQEDRFRDLLAQVKRFEIQASSKIQRGGVFIETGSGTVDATLKTQLSVIAEVFQAIHQELEEVTDVESEAFDDLNQPSS